MGRPSAAATTCPDCGGTKGHSSARCFACSIPHRSGPRAGTGPRLCRSCDRILAHVEFRLRKENGKQVRSSTCLDCERRAARERARRAKVDPTRAALAQLRHRINRLGLDVDAVLARWRAHDGRCDLCGGDNGGRVLCLDHCHRTGALRGFLCGSCNTAIGHLRDDPALIRAAADYVERGGV